MNGTLYEQLFQLTERDTTFEKETTMFTPEIRNACTWLAQEYGLRDLAELRREHVSGYLLHLRQSEKAGRNRHYVNAHTFGVHLVCTVLYYASVVKENYAVPRNRSHWKARR